MSRFEVGRTASARPISANGRELLLWVSGPQHGECRYLADGETIDLVGPATVFLVQEP